MNAYRLAGKIIPTIILVAGIGLCMWSFGEYMKAKGKENTWIKAKGVITGFQEKAIYRAPIIAFYTQEREKITFVEKLEKNQDLITLTEGDRVPILYNPANPSEAVIDQFTYKNFLYIFLGIFGGFLLFLGFLLKYVFSRKASRYEKVMGG